MLQLAGASAEAGSAVPGSTETTNVETEAPTPAPALQVAALVQGLRASPAARADYSVRLNTEPNLLSWSQALKTQASAGDADAAATLSALYLACAETLSYPFVPRPSAAGRPPPADPKAADPKAAAKQRCAGMGEPGELTALKLRSSAKAWKSTAAHLEHAPSVLESLMEIREVRGFGPIHPAEFPARAAAQELMSEGNYAELAVQSYALSQLSDINSEAPWRQSLCPLARSCGPRTRCQSACEARYLASSTLSLPPGRSGYWPDNSCRSCRHCDPALWRRCGGNPVKPGWQNEPKSLDVADVAGRFSRSGLVATDAGSACWWRRNRVAQISGCGYR